MSMAETLLQQLRGKRFSVMTGAHTFSGSANALSFRLPPCRDRINGVHIAYQPNDLYTVEFLRLRASEREVVKTVEDIGSENLCRIFTETTGLYLHLGTMGIAIS